MLLAFVERRHETRVTVNVAQPPAGDIPRFGKGFRRRTKDDGARRERLAVLSLSASSAQLVGVEFVVFVANEVPPDQPIFTEHLYGQEKR
jgi:hypothetical protein